MREIQSSGPFRRLTATSSTSMAQSTSAKHCSPAPPKQSLGCVPRGGGWCCPSRITGLAAGEQCAARSAWEPGQARSVLLASVSWVIREEHHPPPRGTQPSDRFGGAGQQCFAEVDCAIEVEDVAVKRRNGPGRLYFAHRGTITTRFGAIVPLTRATRSFISSGFWPAPCRSLRQGAWPARDARQQDLLYPFVCSFCARRAQKLRTKKMVYHSAEG